MLQELKSSLSWDEAAEEKKQRKKRMTTVRRQDAVGGDSGDVTDLTDEGNHQRVISAVFAQFSAAFSCTNDQSLLTSESQCGFPYSSLAPPAALLQKLTD